MKRNILIYSIILAAGIFLGWLIFGHSGNTAKDSVPVEQEVSIWTCSMHPQIRQDHPGKCPLCGMDLIPVKTRGASGDTMNDPDVIQLSKEAAALANIQTTPVNRANPAKQLLLYGTIQADERLSRTQVSHVSGRIEKLSVNFTGETVNRGQVIASLYSPDLQNAQQELLEAIKLQTLQPALLTAAREKLRQWKLTEEQISAIEQSGKVMPVINLVADFSGSVIAKKVEQGDYVAAGSPLFDLIDLSSVWALFSAYESDLPYLKIGDKVTFRVQALPGKNYSGTITFIDPVLDKTTRTAKVRVETANPGLYLKPEMYAEAVIQASLKQQSGAIVIPQSSVLWTGKRSIVYVKQPDSETPAFKLREIELGPSLGDSFVVLSGIAEGEEIVTNGVFVIDASAQLEGKTSMMNEKTPTETEEEATIIVQGLCVMCKDRIEKTAKSITGIFSAVWNIKTKQLFLHYDPSKTSPDDVAKAVARAGHDTEKYKADDAVYQALPECCKYRGK
ncbi:MAG: efflux RND transporter periplasmic adaptor subunit [Candidatus Azobacteroides sp.]|nr:efflux RND transporter periplasmic adaptor subunit [Candidatus Azobacteroides sp.]